MQWARRFWSAFVKTHPPSAAARLATFFEANYGCNANVQSLSRMVGCHHAMLRRQFFREFGMSIVEYRNRVRVEQALILFAQREPGKAVAERTGWNSRKNLYRAIHRFARITPAEVTPTNLAVVIDALRWERHAAAWRTRQGPLR